MKARVESRKSKGNGVIRHGAAAIAVAVGLAGCGIQPRTMEYNYLTYEHPFTDAAAAEVRKNAEWLCGQRRLAAVETSRSCSLTQCTANYQCVSSTDVKIEAPEKKK